MDLVRMMSRRRVDARESASVDLREALSRAARLISGGVARRPWVETVPKLKRSAESASAMRTAWFICPDFKPPSGGIRKLYRTVDILNEAGYSAAIVHKRPGFRCNWFSHDTRIAASDQIVVNGNDIIVVPEIYGRSIGDLPRGVRRVIFNQNIYLTMQSLFADPTVMSPYIDDPELSAVLVVSDDNAKVAEYCLPGVQVRRVRIGIDTTLYYPPDAPKRRRIAYMPRKRGREAVQVLELLRRRGALEGWDVVAIDGRSEAEVGEVLRTAQIFLALGEREGFGLPPLEALACGCVVVGYHGFGGREIFRYPFATAVEDGDIAAFAQAVENIISLARNDPAAMMALSRAGIQFARENYSENQERQDLLDAFVPLLQH